MARVIILLGLVFVFSVACGSELQDQYLVRFKTKPDHSLLRQFGSNVELLRDFTIGTRATWLVQGQLKNVESLPSVLSIEPNQVIKLTDVSPTFFRATSGGHVTSAQNEAECARQEGDDIWGLIRTSHEFAPDYSAHAYEWQEDGEGVRVYVVDTGVERENPEFGGRVVTEGFVAQGVREEGDADLFGHGTYVASIAAGSTYGAAKHAQIVPVKVMNEYGTGPIADIIEGIEWVTEQVGRQREDGQVPKAIINLSLGGIHSEAFQEALSHASRMGISIISAAGNQATDARESFPAAYDVTIAVGASDREDHVVEFSNHGCKVAVYAPGKDVAGAWSRESAMCEGKEECLMTMSGTSASAPLAAGILARWLSGFNNDQMRELLEEPRLYQDILTSTAVRERLSFPNEEVNELSHNLLLHKSCGQREWDRNRAVSTCGTSVSTTTRATEKTSTTKFSTTPTATDRLPSTTTRLVESDKDNLSVAEIVGITAACVACVLLVVVVVMLCRRPPAPPAAAYTNQAYGNGPSVVVVPQKIPLPATLAELPPVYQAIDEKKPEV